jgi:hypothetical protein
VAWVNVVVPLLVTFVLTVTSIAAGAALALALQERRVGNHWADRARAAFPVRQAMGLGTLVVSVKLCDSGSPDAVSTLKVLSNEGDQVLINVPGPGGSISIGTQVNYAYSSSPVLLAPERKVKVHGSPSDVPPVFGAFYVKSLKTSGNVLVEDQWVDDLPCHPYP